MRGTHFTAFAAGRLPMPSMQKCKNSGKDSSGVPFGTPLFLCCFMRFSQAGLLCWGRSWEKDGGDTWTTIPAAVDFDPGKPSSPAGKDPVQERDGLDPGAGRPGRHGSGWVRASKPASAWATVLRMMPAAMAWRSICSTAAVTARRFSGGTS